MKKLLLTIFAMSFAIAMNSQTLRLLPANDAFLSSDCQFRNVNGWNWDTILCYNTQNILIERMFQTFDPSGYPLSQVSQKPENSSWTNYIRSTNTNDMLGRLLSVLNESWNGITWVALNRVDVTWDASGKIIMETVEKWQSGTWVKDLRRSYTYNEAGKKGSMLQEDWTGIWINDLISSYEYDANGNIKTVTNGYSESGGPWNPGSRFNYTCDIQGNYVEMIMEEWENAIWSAVFKITYINDSENNILVETGYSWTSGSWLQDSRKVYTYDQYGNALTGKNEQWVAGDWQPDMGTSYIYYKKEYIQLMNISLYRYEASYRSFVSAGDIENEEKFSISPNPAKDFFIIQSDKKNNNNSISVFNMNGMLVRILKNNEGPDYISTSDFENGTYLVRMGSYTQKLIICK